MPALNRSTLLALLLVVPAMAWATPPPPTDTATPTATASITPTVTPGSGSFSLVSYAPDGSTLGSPVLVNGSTGNAMDILYVAGEPWAPGGGLLTVVFPVAMGTPQGYNFWVAPGQSGQVLGYSFVGQSVQIQLRNVSQGQQLNLRYGQNAVGFAVNSTMTSEVVTLYSYPQSVSLGAGGVVPTPISIPVYSATNTPTMTPTYTVSPTFTVSPTSTVTPTSTNTPDWTHTVTPTETPLGPPAINGVYAYPNPFDERRYDKVTFRFPPSDSATVTVFSLTGQPVRVLDSVNVQATAGWALWQGEDDYMRKVAGGLYFVRVKTASGTYIKKFTVLN